MAITKTSYDNIKSYLDEGVKIAELGAQYVMGDEWGGYGPPYFKNIFSDLDITSFDMNGENNSEKVNLSFPIDEKYKNMYDIVTNFGTTEHVQDQYNCWKNIFDITKPGGLVISEIPKRGNWIGHCKYYFDENSFKSMNKDFEIVEFKDVVLDSQGALIFCVMKKKNNSQFSTTETQLLKSIQIIESFDDTQGY